MPTLDQERLLWGHVGVRRFAYNKMKSLSEKYYKHFGKTLSVVNMGKMITRMKNRDKYKWLKEYNADVPKEAIRDFDKARQKSFADFGNAYHTKFKSKYDLYQGFALDHRKCKVKKKTICITKVGYVKTSRQLPRKRRLSNPRVVFDGLHWYISVGVETAEIEQMLSDDVIGVDVGIKDLCVASDGFVVTNINKTPKVKKLINEKKKYQQQMSKRFVKGQEQSNNYNKAKQKHLKVSRKLNNIRDNHIHQTTNTLVKAKPSKIVVEDLSVQFMLKNKKLSKAVSYQKINFFFNCLAYKCKLNKIEYIKAPRFYASSKICNCCGYKYNSKDCCKQWGLHIRSWECVKCNVSHNRDMNAAINLSKLVV